MTFYGVLEMRNDGTVNGGVEKACHGVSELYSRHFPKAGGGHFDASLRSVRSHWRTFRPVSHYWAAYLILWRELKTSALGAGDSKMESAADIGVRRLGDGGLFFITDNDMQLVHRSIEGLAKALSVKPDTTQASPCRDGHYFGIRQTKLPNRRLLWPADAVARLLAGNVEVK